MIFDQISMIIDHIPERLNNERTHSCTCQYISVNAIIMQQG